MNFFSIEAEVSGGREKNRVGCPTNVGEQGSFVFMFHLNAPEEYYDIFLQALKRKSEFRKRKKNQ